MYQFGIVEFFTGHDIIYYYVYQEGKRKKGVKMLF